MDGFWVLICCVAVVLALGLGGSTGRDGVVKDCETLGLFRDGAKVYICHAK